MLGDFSDYTCFDGCLYIALSKKQREMHKLAEEIFKPLELSPNHCYILILLLEKGSLPVGKIALILGLSPSTLTRFVDSLEKKGYVKKEKKGRVMLIHPLSALDDISPDLYSRWQDFFKGYNRLYGSSFVSSATSLLSQDKKA